MVVFFALLSCVTAALGAVLAGSVFQHAGGQLTAAFLNLICMGMIGCGMALNRSKKWRNLILFCVGFGTIELLADSLCVEVTKTLDYSVSHSWMILSSPWWMPLSWALVACQIMLLSDALARLLGKRYQIIAAGTLSVAMLAFHEHAAYAAHWWQYKNCSLIGKAPLYVLLAELLIGGMLGWFMMQTTATLTLWDVLRMVIIAGGCTVLAGIIGFGCVEVIPVLLQGKPHPLMPFVFK